MDTPLIKPGEAGWYGRNDFKPLPCGKKTCYIIVAILTSPVWLVLLALYVLVICCVIGCGCVAINANQWATGKILGFEGFYKAPGKKLDVKETGPTSSDIIIGDEFVVNGNINTCKKWSLRKSVEVSVMDHLRKSKFWSQIEADTDRDKPHYFIHGWTSEFDPSGDEVWTTPASVASWAAMYSWSGHLPGKITQAIPLADCPDTFGYIYLIDMANAQEFYSGGSKVHRVGAAAANAPEHTPGTDGKIFARYGYGHSKSMGDFDPDGLDAYIFKGKVVKDANLRILHTFRVRRPGAGQP